MAGERSFTKGVKGIRSGCECVKKPKQKLYVFDKYRIYNTSRWRHLRDRVLKSNPICNVCQNALAQEVDHITPFSTGMTDRQKMQLGFDITNLQSICTSCHDNKHNRLNINTENEI